jgi:hypothetical protein
VGTAGTEQKRQKKDICLSIHKSAKSEQYLVYTVPDNRRVIDTMDLSGETSYAKLDNFDWSLRVG